jgi:two-component system, NtrC family, response regulator HydG
MTSELVPRRCVVWFGQPTTEECSALAQAGWCTRVGDVAAQGGVGMRRDDVVVAMADLRRSNIGTVQAMGRLMDDYPWLPWLAVVLQETSADTPEVERILRASADFFTVPIDVKRLIETLTKINHGWSPAVEREDIPGIVGAISPVMRATMASLRKYAPVELPVLITGETGSGKEVAARALHGLSERCERPFVAINCGALPLNLVQSELFGHERGAFTGANARRVGHFEAADGGTVFLDEIGDLPLDAQTSLLRLLQEGTFLRVGSSSQPVKLNVRVLAATHVDLDLAVAQGRFREDLYYRLNVLRLHMPALRERNGDVELLAQHFLDTFRLRHQSRGRAFSSGARQAMRDFAWPGNVRELLNRVQRAAVVAEGTLISAADLDLQGTPSAIGCSNLDLTRVSAEREAVLKCLHESHFNISECGRRLNVSRVTVYRLCKKHHILLDVLRGGAPFGMARSLSRARGGERPVTQNL